jgi:cytochrome b
MNATASEAAAAPHSGQSARVRVWDLPLRLFHWLLVLAIAVAFLSSEGDSPLNQWHVLSGWVAGILIVFRIVWGFVGGEHSRFVDFVRPGHVAEHISGLFRRRTESALGHNPLGGISVLVLLALAAVTVGTGAFGGERMEDLHELIAWTLLAFVGLHILAVVIMTLLERENLVRAMIVGTKSADLHPGAADAKRPSVLGLVVTAVVLAGTVYGILQYDPQAFTLRRAEAFENRGNPNADTAAEQEEGEEER